MAPIKLERSYSLGGGTKRTVSDVERRMREPSTDRYANPASHFHLEDEVLILFQ